MVSEERRRVCCCDFLSQAYWPILDCEHGSFDRMHIGSAITHYQKGHFLKLLAPDGLLVSPIEDGLYVIRWVNSLLLLYVMFFLKVVLGILWNSRSKLSLKVCSCAF